MLCHAQRTNFKVQKFKTCVILKGRSINSSVQCCVDTRTLGVCCGDWRLESGTDWDKIFVLNAQLSSFCLPSTEPSQGLCLKLFLFVLLQPLSCFHRVSWISKFKIMTNSQSPIYRKSVSPSQQRQPDLFKRDNNLLPWPVIVWFMLSLVHHLHHCSQELLGFFVFFREVKILSNSHLTVTQ